MGSPGIILNILSLFSVVSPASDGEKPIKIDWWKMGRQRESVLTLHCFRIIWLALCSLHSGFLVWNSSLQSFKLILLERIAIAVNNGYLQSFKIVIIATQETRH